MNLSGEGISLPANPSNAQIRGEIDALMYQIKDGVDNTAVISDILLVPYIDTNPNYTGGMLSNPQFSQQLNEYQASHPAPSNAAAGVVIGLINGITNMVGGIISGIQQQNIAEIEQQNLQMQLEHDRDKFESGKIFGIPMIVVLAMIGFLAFVSYLAYKKK